MSPLSTFKYIMNNISKTLPVLISMVVSVLLIYIFSLVTKSTFEMADLTVTNIFSKYTIVMSNNQEPIPSAYLEKITNDKNVGNIIPSINNNGYLRYDNIFGGMSIEVMNFYEEDIPKVITTLNMELIEGTLPRLNKNEIIIPKKYALQNKLKTGDYIGSEISSSYGLKGKYRISGITEGPAVMAVISNNDNAISRDTAMKQSLLFSVKNLQDKNLINYLSENTPKNVLIMDYYSTSIQMKEIFNSMNALSYILNIIIILVLCISLGNLNYINFLNRKYEFGVLSAIGYKKSALYFKLWKENLTVCILGYIGGILLSTLIALILNLTILYPEGKFLPLWSISGAGIAIFLPVIISFLTLIAPIKELRKTDPLDVIGGVI